MCRDSKNQHHCSLVSVEPMSFATHTFCYDQREKDFQWIQFRNSPYRPYLCLYCICSQTTPLIATFLQNSTRPGDHSLGYGLSGWLLGPPALPSHIPNHLLLWLLLKLQTCLGQKCSLQWDKQILAISESISKIEVPSKSILILRLSRCTSITDDKNPIICQKSSSTLHKLIEINQWRSWHYCW